MTDFRSILNSLKLNIVQFDIHSRKFKSSNECQEWNEAFYDEYVVKISKLKQQLADIEPLVDKMLGELD